MNYEELIQRKLDNLKNGYSLSSNQSTERQEQDNGDHLITLFNQAQHQQQKMQQKVQQANEEIKCQANKLKIDQNSQKILLKKLEQQLNSIITKYQLDDQINKDGYTSILLEIGIDDNDIHQELWLLLTFDLHIKSIFTGFLFNIMIVFLEKQLSNQQVFIIIMQASQLINDVLQDEIDALQIPDNLIDFVKLEDLVSRLIIKFKITQIQKPQKIQRPTSSQKKESTPKITQKNRQVVDLEVVNRFDLLYEHSKVLQEKRRNLESKIQDDPECSFKPQLNTNVKEKRNLNTFNRLYQNASIIKQNHQIQKANLQKQQQEDEMMECTFKPKLTVKQKFSYKPVKGETVIIERMNKARQQKLEKENFYTEQSNQHAKYSKITKPEPFELSKTNVPEQKEIILNADIRISKSKKARITIKEGDNIDQVVKGFAKAYQLNEDQIEVIKNTLINYL